MNSIFYLVSSSIFCSFSLCFICIPDTYNHVCAHMHTQAYVYTCLHVHIWSFPRYLGKIIQSPPPWKYTGKKRHLSLVPLKCCTEFFFTRLLSRSVSESVENTHSPCPPLLTPATGHITSLHFLNIFSLLQFWRLAVHYSTLQSWHVS